MITRRMFHARLMAAMAALALPAPAFAATGGAVERRWLNRLTFGASGAGVEEARRLGLAGWLDWQLSLPATDPALEARLAAARLRISYPADRDEDGNRWPAVDELRPLSSLWADPADLVALVEWGKGRGMAYGERIRPAHEVIAASLIRTVHAKAQLREVMTQFWHDHFNVDSGKDQKTAAFFAGFDATLRSHALGNFRQLLGEVARAPAMLYYLDNADSIASPANENFARELLELHTLGAASYLSGRHANWREVPGAKAGLAEGYLDHDVYEVARAFTGWTVGDGRVLAEGETAPRSGRIHYVARWHDPYQKRILGREFAPDRAPMADGDEVLDMLARHPATARLVCEKIARRLLSDDPPAALVDRMVTTFLAAHDADDQIARVIRVLVLSPEFEAPATKLRRPFEFLAALYRATGAEVAAENRDWHWYLTRAGWRQHQYGPPTGHPDRLEAWTGASALNRIVDLALYAHDQWFGAVRVDLAATGAANETALAFLVRHGSALAPEAAAGIAAELVAAYGFGPENPAADIAAGPRKDAAAMAIAFAALTPEFMLR
jgi:uncharacterized protein (DUF1800 family)